MNRFQHVSQTGVAFNTYQVICDVTAGAWGKKF